MKKRSLLVAAVVAILSVGALAGDKGYSDLKFVVVKDANGKPVRNASVILHAVNKNGKQEKGGLQLKTNAEGQANYAGIPYGKLRIQVIATGFQTFGEDFDINKPAMEINIRVKKPQDQVTIYGEKK
ncbi:MAG: carboxypeptidase regulatory-like domain-containing protein [Candidatus Koribacter versatilis]|uniref:Carboxypeptidase regulatory-like domain-containing protein n=1 Tax=Candidatus Korobacter versatilis TaxID=658062 RepID=A0A932A7Z1_9BACT|nr:carboxypeptidase regulatory-like domain-containing protein [Candidatus Koribacter versatilis]